MKWLTPGGWAGELRVLGLLGALVLSGCATPGVPLDEVTEAPIAVVYWEGPAARERAELIDELSGREAERGRLGMASMDEVIRMAGSKGGLVASQRLAQIPGRIVLLNARTLEKKRFYCAPPNARPLAWSRDHKKMLFNSDHLEAGRNQIYECDIETGEVRRLTQGPAYHLEGDYGPRNEFLTTWIDADAGGQGAGMDVLSPSGEKVRTVVSGFYPTGPRWSPREELIVYVEADNRGRSQDASVVIVQGSEAGDDGRRLGRGRDAVFSPDGKWIVFSSQGTKGWRLQRMRPDGSARKILGVSTLSARWPAISPDGRHIAYVSDEDGLDRLYLRRMDGSGDRILLADGAVAFPIW